MRLLSGLSSGDGLARAYHLAHARVKLAVTLLWKNISKRDTNRSRARPLSHPLSLPIACYRTPGPRRTIHRESKQKANDVSTPVLRGAGRKEEEEEEEEKEITVFPSVAPDRLFSRKMNDGTFATFFFFFLTQIIKTLLPPSGVSVAQAP